MSGEDLERYETEIELQLYREYRDVLPMFQYVVETERRFYLANDVQVEAKRDGGQVYFELELRDAWVWDMYRPARFVTNVKVLTFRDVNVEELADEGASSRAAVDGRTRPIPPRLGADGEDAVAAVVRAARATTCSTATGASAKASSTSCCDVRRTLVFCEVKTRRGDALRHAVRGRDPRPSSGGSARSRCAGCRSTACGAASCASTSPRCAMPRRGARRDRGDRGRVLTSAVPTRGGRFAVPAAGVPVPACRRVVARDHDLVALPGRDLVVAARAAVRLHRLVRLDVADLELVERAHGLARSSWRHRVTPKKAHTTQRRDHHERGDDDDDVGATIDAAPERVEAHGSYGTGR